LSDEPRHFEGRTPGNQKIIPFFFEFQQLNPMLCASGETKRCASQQIAILHCCNAITTDAASQQIAYRPGATN
jgi:hypothetical protein